MFRTVRATPIDYPHIPDDVNELSIRDILDSMTWGVCYRITDRVALEVEKDDKTSLEAEMGLCWIDRNYPGAATVYIDGKPYAFQDVDWLQRQCQRQDVRQGYQLTGVPSGRLTHYGAGDSHGGERQDAA